MRRFTRRPGVPVRTIAYAQGGGRDGDLYLPAGDAQVPVVMLIHGGYWRVPWGRNLMHALAGALVSDGWAVWNVEYRRIGSGGGWPATFEDVAAATDALAGLDDRIDLQRVCAAGHSAGGHLALWTAARARLPAGTVGAEPLVRPHAVVSLAGMGDLKSAAARRLGADAVVALLGGTVEQVPERYRTASPAAQLPLRVPQLMVHGDADEVVPIEVSREYAQAARAAGDTVEVLEVAGGDHYTVIDAAAPAWREVTAWIGRAVS